MTTVANAAQHPHRLHLKLKFIRGLLVVFGTQTFVSQTPLQAQPCRFTFKEQHMTFV